MSEQSTNAPTLADEIASVRLLLTEMSRVKHRTPQFENHIVALRAVLARLLEIKPEGEDHG